MKTVIVDLQVYQISDKLFQQLKQVEQGCCESYNDDTRDELRAACKKIHRQDEIPVDGVFKTPAIVEEDLPF